MKKKKKPLNDNLNKTILEFDNKDKSYFFRHDYYEAQ